MTSQRQTCVNTPILDTLRHVVTDQDRVSRPAPSCAELPVNDLGAEQLALFLPGADRGGPRGLPRRSAGAAP